MVDEDWVGPWEGGNSLDLFFPELAQRYHLDSDMPIPDDRDSLEHNAFAIPGLCKQDSVSKVVDDATDAVHLVRLWVPTWRAIPDVSV